jgi:hypothetical protein
MPATRQDAIDLAPRLRPEDNAEVLAASGLEPEAGLLHCFDNSIECYAIVTETGEVAGLFGVCKQGMVWLLGSEELVQRKTRFLRWSRQIVQRLKLRHGHLWNFVDERNSVHHRWIQWCGFRFTGQAINLKDPNVKFLHFEHTEE